MNHIIKYETWTFTADKIKSGNLYLATSLLSSSLEVSSLLAEVECEDPSILDFQRNAQLLYYTRDNICLIFRVQTIKRIGPNLYEIFSTSTLGLLTEGQHMGGIYTGQRAEDVIGDICGNVPYIVKSSLKDVQLYGWLPIATPRDNLAQVLFALGATLKTDLDGVLRIEGLWDGVSETVGKDSMYTDAAVDYSAKITQVIVTEHQYVPWTEEQQLFEGTAQAGDIITFNEPMHSLTAEGFTILDSGANWARVSAGSGVLKGLTYLHNTRQVSEAVSSAATPNVKTVEDATLVSLVNSAAVAHRLAIYYQCTQRVDSSVVYDGENPGDVIDAYHPFDKVGVSACLESADITLSNTLKASEKLLVGYIPPQIEDSEYFNAREVLVGTGEWTAPDNDTDVTVVCIGGAWGGWSGLQGGQTEKCASMNYSWTGITGTSHTISGYCASVGGNGGEPGLGGSGGRIFQATFRVKAHQKIAYQTGIGGIGGVYSDSGSQQGAEGTPSIFGPFSSADGEANPAGYLDIVTGERFAATGEAGIAGGSGSGGPERAPDEWNIDPNNDTFFLDGSTVTGRDGQQWTPARKPVRGKGSADWSGDTAATKDRSNELLIEGCFGLSGGAAVGANGTNGPRFTNFSVSISGTTLSASGTAAKGGKGANASAPGKRAGNAGSGGYGGNGGGGAGGSCEFHTEQIRTEGASSATFKRELLGQMESLGPGIGSDGGQGGDGCVILYYREAQVRDTGRFIEKNGRDFIELFSRRFIV